MTLFAGTLAGDTRRPLGSMAHLAALGVAASAHNITFSAASNALLLSTGCCSWSTALILASVVNFVHRSVALVGDVLRKIMVEPIGIYFEIFADDVDAKDVSRRVPLNRFVYQIKLGK